MEPVPIAEPSILWRHLGTGGIAPRYHALAAHMKGLKS